MASDTNPPLPDETDAQSGKRRPGLTRDQVLAAALAIYRHAMDEDALLDGVVERFVSEFVAPLRPDGDRVGDWDAALRRHAHAFRRVSLAHPRVVPLLVTRPLSGPLARQPAGMLRPLEELLGLFTAAGFDQRGALHAARLFTGFLYGHVLHELQERGQPRRDRRRAAPGTAPAADHPVPPHPVTGR
jgi:AcrR family transcriptional regulator